MSLKSTATRYGSVAIAVHWTSALVILAALGGGLVMGNATDPALIRTILPFHMTLGVLALLLTLFRIAWWIWSDKRPDPVEGLPVAQEWAARIVHGLLYVLLVALVASGLATTVLSGALPALLSGAPLPDFDLVPPRAAHGIFAWVLIALLVFHIGAALYHQFIRRDRLLARMGLGS
ncbi:MAG TPA: cytochrome b/b6 domain-containing protein [Devosia sp.]|nr:cytochrome b/b6 domain-containing protein [Devosia sp.]